MASNITLSVAIQRAASLKRPAFAAAIIALSSSPALAQTDSAEYPYGTRDGGDASLINPDAKYLIPDILPPPPKSDGPNEHWFTIRPSIAVLGDWTGYDQDSTSVEQVGNQHDAWQMRSARLSLIGGIGKSYRVSYQFSAEFKGFDGDPDTTWSWTDWRLMFPIGDRTKLTIGKQKETLSYEMVGDAANLPHSERVLSPFFVSRNVGATLLTVLGHDKRMTIAVGAYQEHLDFNRDTDHGWDFSARVTGLAWDKSDTEFLHLGVSYRHVADAHGELQLKGRPGTNIGSNFVDTGSFQSSGANNFGFEALGNVGPVSLLGEYVGSKVNSREYGDPYFSGWYLTGSWVLTGETRPYDRNVGYARRVIPKGKFGAPELVARVARVDLTDNGLDGGKMWHTALGLNWWVTARWKLGTSWGHTWLDRDGLNGESNTLLTRIQFVY